MVRAGVLLLMAGCFRPAPPAGAPCAPAGSGERCPAGQVCTVSGGVELCLDTAVGADASGDSSRIDACTTCTPDDTDGDGVLDTDDNCPDAANQDQADEDLDLVGDACDPCPPFAGTTDSDGDGLPDNCDPRPSTPGDVLREFHGFKSGLPATWNADNVVADGAGNAIATAPANGGATLTVARPAGDLTVWADATLDSIAGAALGAIGVMTRSEQGVDDNVVCQLVGQANGGTQALRLFDNTANGGLIAETGHPFAAGLHFEIRVTDTGGMLACVATQPTNMASGNTDYQPNAPELGLRVRSATARYHWVMVIAN